MGLDIYLYTAAEREANDAHDRASNALYDRPDYDELSEDERHAAYAALPPYVSAANPPSELYPDHLFSRRYLRSSYNNSGFNHAVPDLIATSDGGEYPNQEGSLYWIFEPMGREWDGDEGTLTPDDIPKLQASKARALDVAERLRKCDRLRVLTVSPNFLSELPTTDDDAALAMYRKQVADGRIKPDSWWSNIDMNVFGDGLSVLAAVPGKGTFGVPGVHLIYRQADDGYDSYVQAAEITAEFCDEAVSLIERDGSCSLSWSG